MSKKSHGARSKTDISVRDAALIEMRLRGMTLREIAAALGISKTAAWKRLHTERVKKLLDQGRRELFQQTGYSIVSAFNEAVTYLRKVIAGEVEPDGVRVRAAQALISHNAFQALAIEDLRREMEKMREAIEGKYIAQAMKAVTGTDGREALAQGGQDREAAQRDRHAVVEASADADDNLL